mgnify:FL=1
MKETAEKLEGASDESQEKLSSAFKIASSLRKLLEDRENQYATLEGTCRVCGFIFFFSSETFINLKLSQTCTEKGVGIRRTTEETGCCKQYILRNY